MANRSGRLYISDTHYHDFERFAVINDDGINSRLQYTIDATLEAVEAAAKEDISVLIHGGDCFHVRGKVSPSVLNPVIDMYRSIIEAGWEVYMIAGNHDLESKESSELHNTATALQSVGVRVINKPTINHDIKTAFFPWHSSKNDLLATMLTAKKELEDGGHKVEEYNAVIHAPLNDVIVGIPNHGLNASQLDKFGFKRVFCGHYHNFKEMGNVVSIGSLTHQKFGDVNSISGYIIEDDGELKQYECKSAPRFIDIDSEEPPDTQEELEELVKGNYVRVRLKDATETDIAEMRQELKDAGALDSLIQNTRTKGAATTRTASTVSAGSSMETSVSDWIKGRGFDRSLEKDIEKAAIDILSEV